MSGVTTTNTNPLEGSVYTFEFDDITKQKKTTRYIQISIGFLVGFLLGLFFSVIL